MALERRKKITTDISDRKKKMKERGDTMQQAVDDKKRIANTAKELKLATTKEGVDRMKKEIKQATEKTSREFEKQNNSLEKKVAECKKSDTELRQKTQAAEGNIRKIKQVEGQIKEAKQAKSDLSQAANAAQDDRKFTKSEGKRQEDFKRGSEGRRNRQRGQLNSIGLPW